MAIFLAGALMAGSVADEIMAAEQAWARAAIAADAAALDRLLAADLRYSHTDGKFDTKADFLRLLREGSMKYEQAEVEEIRVRPFGSAAVSEMVMKLKVIRGGRAAEFRARVLRVWAKVDGRWQLAAHQSARLAP
ncbi:MAG: nuclear transport factor 2 family protein [Bryobacteraceae bacterium]|nr:nuclear transport factor 2 family protein [Bryobacteraceae bacterium]